MEALSQSQMIDQESKGWGGEGRARWAENLVQVEGHRRTWKAKREIAAEFSLCWCARCQTAVWVLVGTSRFSLCTAPSPPPPPPLPSTHTYQGDLKTQLLPEMEGQGHFVIMLIGSIHQDGITSVVGQGLRIYRQ